MKLGMVAVVLALAACAKPEYRQVGTYEYEITAMDQKGVVKGADKACPTGWQIESRVDAMHWRVQCIDIMPASKPAT
jgi:hypothetical protein